MLTRKMLFFWVVLAVSIQVFGDVRLPSVISGNMVLQQKTQVPIWGWADPNETVEVKGSWQWVGISTQADQQGKWQVKVKTPPAGGPFELMIKANNTIILKNILSGEVWLCSGQSNMRFPLSKADNAEKEIASADNPNIRLCTVELTTAQIPQDDCQGSWLQCTPEIAKSFSAVGYLFGKELNSQLNVPVGLIGSYWGGTPVEAWTERKVLTSDPNFEPVLRRYANLEKTRKGRRIPKHVLPGTLYNAMISPLIPYTIAGAIWYQGESNVARAYQYRSLFPAMIKNWRDQWNQGDFPFYFVQIAPFRYEMKNDGRDPETAAELREAQLMTLSVPNTGMAVTLDIGDPNDVHPTDKLTVAKRLALWALAKIYSQNDLVYSGPIYKFMQIEGNKIRLKFDHAGSGLMAKDMLLEGFTMAGPDKQFHQAAAVIDQDTVLVSCVKVDQPAAVRYAWQNAPTGNLFNKEGLPASSFRTDNWPAVTKDKD